MSRFVFATAIACAAPAYAQTTYFTAIPDLPIATGLSESEHPLASFAGANNAELVIADAHGPTPAPLVERFYSESLSALGWSYDPTPREDGLTFMRGRERLVLHIEPQGTGSYLRVRLIVRPASMNAD